MIITDENEMISFPNIDLYFIIIPPPEVGCKQGVVACHSQKVLRQLVYRGEVLGVNVAVRRSNAGHIGSGQDHGDDVVGQDVEVLLCHVVLQRRTYGKSCFDKYST